MTSHQLTLRPSRQQPLSLNMWFLDLKSISKAYSFDTWPSSVKYLNDYIFICWSSDRCKKQGAQEYVYSTRNWAQRDKDHSKGGLSFPVQPCPWSLVYSEGAGLLLLRQERFTSHRKGWSSGMEKHSYLSSLALLSRWKLFLHTPSHPPFCFLAAEYTKQSTTPFYETQRQRHPGGMRWG